ncbi:MAG: HDOD domain-containing protein [Phycisphaerae bacterium]|nr:HDOD domain-containing protein [Phycisphaerae bacterium]
MSDSADPNRARRLELILQQVDALPTLPVVVMRLLQITRDDDSDARDVIELVKTDPALSSKVLKMCHGAHLGLRGPVTTVDRAVVLLGFDAIRNAVLSIKVVQAFTAPGVAEADETEVGFDRPAFWRHCLAVAIASELIASAHRQPKRLDPAEAFICGLLHDIGKLVLDHLLPKSYQRVVELTDKHQFNIADVERRVIGLDHHTVGKRLAEHWRLPHLLQDCIWLHGAPYQTLPEIPHRQMVALVGVADLLVRRQHLGYSGNFALDDRLADRAREAGLDPKLVNSVTTQLHEELHRRTEAMGLGEAPSRELFLESILQANEVLGRLNRKLQSNRQQFEHQADVLQAIVQFHQSSTLPGRNVQDVLSATAASAATVLQGSYYAMLYQGGSEEPWLLNQYTQQGRLLHSQFVDPPAATPPLSRLIDPGTVSMPLLGLLPWLGDYLLAEQDVRELKMLALPCSWGISAVMIHDSGQLPPTQHLEAVAHTWGSAIGAAAQHQGARRLGEQLVEANRQLVEAQDTLLQNQSLARLGEMAAGAAHEMNNPLAVISGRAQLLASRLEAGSGEQQDAEQIREQAERLSQLITSLRLFADPPRPQLHNTSWDQISASALQLLRQRVPEKCDVQVVEGGELPELYTDEGQVADILAELLVNAAQAESDSPPSLAASVDSLNDRFIIKVRDEGVGMTPAVLEHALDPFFSAKPAGRQAGLGLARASRLAEGLGGEIDLNSEPGRGTTVTVSLPLKRPSEQDSPAAERGSDDVTEGKRSAVDSRASRS